MLALLSTSQGMDGMALSTDEGLSTPGGQG
jgi:hypothetical protein